MICPPYVDTECVQALQKTLDLLIASGTDEERVLASLAWTIFTRTAAGAPGAATSCSDFSVLHYMVQMAHDRTHLAGGQHAN